MTRARLTTCLSVAVLGAALAVANATARSSGDNTLSFTAGVSSVNPCTGESVSGPLDVLLVVNSVFTGNGRIHVNVHGSVHGQLVGNLGTTYELSAEGTDQVDFVSGSYDFTFRGEGISHTSAPNLTFDGVARVFVNGDGDPVGGTVVSLSPNCL